MSRTLIGVSMNDDSVRLLCQCFVPLHSFSKNTKSFHILSDPQETTAWSTWSYCKKYWSKRHDRNFRKEPIQSGFIYLVVWAARLIYLQFYQTALFLSCLLLTTFTANSPCLDPLLIVSCSNWGTLHLQSTPGRCLSQYWTPLDHLPFHSFICKSTAHSH